MKITTIIIDKQLDGQYVVTIDGTEHSITSDLTAARADAYRLKEAVEFEKHTDLESEARIVDKIPELPADKSAVQTGPASQDQTIGKVVIPRGPIVQEVSLGKVVIPRGPIVQEVTLRNVVIPRGPIVQEVKLGKVVIPKGPDVRKITVGKIVISKR